MAARKIIGIDPGLSNTGWAVIEINGQHLKYVKSGTISTLSSQKIEQRLSKIYAEMQLALQAHNPTEAAIEDVYVNNNPLSSLKLGQARAASILAASNYGLEVFEYAPRLIKKSITGSGKAEKEQIMAMVKYLMPLAFPNNEHESDAIAVAIAHSSMSRYKSIIES